VWQTLNLGFIIVWSARESVTSSAYYLGHFDVVVVVVKDCK